MGVRWKETTVARVALVPPRASVTEGLLKGEARQTGDARQHRVCLAGLAGVALSTSAEPPQGEAQGHERRSGST